MNAASRPHLSAAEPGPGPDADQHLSSLVDGECPQAVADGLCDRWRTDDRLRDDWHVYHLIGDVLRSDDLADPAGHDNAMLQALRQRLAVEPVPLAPAPLTARLPAPVPARRWLAPAAMVAGVVAVGVVTVALRAESGSGPSGWNKQPVAVAPSADPGSTRQVTTVAPPASGPGLIFDRQLLRDARLDALFEAHRGALGGSPSTVPDGALRSVEILAPAR